MDKSRTDSGWNPLVARTKINKQMLKKAQTRTEWSVRREDLLEEMFSSKYFLEPARVTEQGARPVLFLPKLSVVSFQATPLGSIIFHPLGIREPGAGHNGVVVRDQIKGGEPERLSKEAWKDSL